MHELSKDPHSIDVIQHDSFSEQITLWKGKLGIDHYTIVTFKVPLELVTVDEHETAGEFVGITPNHEKKFVAFFHTRPLEEDDIVHELLHIRYPEWDEDKINLKTGELLELTE